MTLENTPASSLPENPIPLCFEEFYALHGETLNSLYETFNLILAGFNNNDTCGELLKSLNDSVLFQGIDELLDPSTEKQAERSVLKGFFTRFMNSRALSEDEFRNFLEKLATLGCVKGVGVNSDVLGLEAGVLSFEDEDASDDVPGNDTSEMVAQIMAGVVDAEASESGELEKAIEEPSPFQDDDMDMGFSDEREDTDYLEGLIDDSDDSVESPLRSIAEGDERTDANELLVSGEGQTVAEETTSDQEPQEDVSNQNVDLSNSQKKENEVMGRKRKTAGAYIGVAAIALLAFLGLRDGKSPGANSSHTSGQNDGEKRRDNEDEEIELDADEVVEKLNAALKKLNDDIEGLVEEMVRPSPAAIRNQLETIISDTAQHQKKMTEIQKKVEEIQMPTSDIELPSFQAQLEECMEKNLQIDPIILRAYVEVEFQKSKNEDGGDKLEVEEYLRIAHASKKAAGMIIYEKRSVPIEQFRTFLNGLAQLEKRK